MRLAILLALAGCVDDAKVVSPVIDQPVDDPDALAAPFDELILTVAHAGNPRDLVSQAIPRGQDAVLPGIPFGDDLVFHMAGAVGNTNVAYGRTCPFQVAANRTTAPPHLFFSRTVKFGTLAASPRVRIGGLGIPYLGTAMLVGGTNGADATQEVEMFDPATGALTELGRVAVRDHAVYALVGTDPARVAVLGGVADGAGARFMEVLDGRQINRFDFLETARTDLTATSLTDGRVIVIGGKDPATGLGSKAIDEVADNDGTFEIRKLSVELAKPRSGHTATRLGDDVGAPVLIVGGVGDDGEPIKTAELFKPLSASLADPGTFHPELQKPRSGHVAALMPDGSVLVIGGVDALGLPALELERFTVDSGFSIISTLPPSTAVLDFAATTLTDGRILLTGGRISPSSPPLDTAYIVRLDPSDGSVDVVQTDHMSVPRAGHQAVLLCDGTVLISGGIGGQFPAERFNPPGTPDRR